MKRPILALIAALPFASSVAFSAPVKHSSTHETDRRSIQRQFQRWVHAYEKGNAQAVTNIYASDAILLLPDMHPIRGHKQLRAFFDRVCRPDVTYTYKVNQLVVTGPWAYRWGSAWVSGPATGNGTRQRRVHLKFIDIWKKQADGTWTIYRDSSVIDKPKSASRVSGS